MRNANGQGGVSKLSGNRRKPYVARVTVSYNKETGSQVYKTLGYFKTRQEGQEALMKYNKAKYDIDQRQLTFTEVYEDWKDRHFKNISQSSIYGYQMAYRRCEKIYEERFSELKTKQLQEVVDDCDKYSIRRTIKVLFNCLYEYADENDIVEKKYNQYVKIGTPVRVYDKQPFTDEEIQILFDNVDKIPFVDTILMMCFSGMRVGELLKQKNADIKLDDRYLIRRE